MANTLQSPKETLAGAKPDWDSLDGAAMVRDGPGWVELTVHSGVKVFNNSVVKRKERN